MRNVTDIQQFLLALFNHTPNLIMMILRVNVLLRQENKYAQMSWRNINMKNIIILTLLLLISCSSAERTEPIKGNPVPKFGCSKYKGKDWEKCVMNLLNKLESIVNIPPSKTLLDSKRYNQEYIIETYSYCFGSNDFCFEESEYVYDPTVIGRLINFSKPLGVGIIVGTIFGLYVP